MEKSAAIVLIPAGKVQESGKAWHRWPSEDEEAYAYFDRYLKMPRPRRIRALLGVSTQLMAEWSRTFAWVERARQFDEYMSGIYEGEIEEALRTHARDVATQYIQMSGTARALLFGELDKWVAIAQENSDGHPVMKLGEWTRLFEILNKIDRLHAGQSTENVSVKTEDLGSVPVENLKKIRDLLRKSGE